MRSRYTAYCQGDADYLITTRHPSTRKLHDAEALQRSLHETSWLGLLVLHATPPHPTETRGVVEFVAFYQAEGVQQLHEVSQFVKENEQWYYLDGEHLPPITLKRNEPCWCGSGKKYKQCHG